MKKIKVNGVINHMQRILEIVILYYVNKKDKEGRIPLYAASEAGHDAVVDLLIKGGADCNENCKDGRTS